jgi:hypothetical protein
MTKSRLALPRRTARRLAVVALVLATGAGGCASGPIVGRAMTVSAVAVVPDLVTGGEPTGIEIELAGPAEVNRQEVDLLYTGEVALVRPPARVRVPVGSSTLRVELETDAVVTPVEVTVTARTRYTSVSRTTTFMVSPAPDSR